MPTPFYHLGIADKILEQSELNPALKSQIKEHLGAFYLGHTAPDVQVISGQKRSATHFFSVPIPWKARLPWEVMLSEHPSLNGSQDLIPRGAVFIAGYLCHLQADWIWVKDIFEPVFGPRQSWKTFSKRLYWHNVLRAYLDVEVVPGLQLDQILELGAANSRAWLPFISNQHLENWWTFLLDQLQPGNQIKTVEVFADRQGIAVHEFRAMLESEESMHDNIFVHISRGQLDDYRSQLVALNVSLIENYLGPMIAPG